MGVNATGVPKDDEEDVDEGSIAAAAALTASTPAPVPGSGGGSGGGGGGTLASDTSGNVGNAPKSCNFGTFNF